MAPKRCSPSDGVREWPEVLDGAGGRIAGEWACGVGSGGWSVGQGAGEGDASPAGFAVVDHAVQSGEEVELSVSDDWLCQRRRIGRGSWIGEGWDAGEKEVVERRVDELKSKAGRSEAEQAELAGKQSFLADINQTIEIYLKATGIRRDPSAYTHDAEQMRLHEKTLREKADTAIAQTSVHRVRCEATYNILEAVVARREAETAMKPWERLDNQKRRCRSSRQLRRKSFRLPKQRRERLGAGRISSRSGMTWTRWKNGSRN